MHRLRVRDPDTLTRVTEYVPEIVSFVERIVQNGYGYAVDGSVYFDTRAFDKADRHDYAKLEPWSKGNRELLEEGEGRLFGNRNGCSCTAHTIIIRCIICRDRTSVSSRLRIVEGIEARRAVLALTVGSGTPRLAH